MTNGGGTYYSPQFDTVGVSDLAPYFMPDGGWHGNNSDYTTAVVGNTSISWLKKVIPGAKAGGKPFMAYIAPKACHEPFTPATWYADHWDSAWPAQEPRPISWNCSAESRANHHGNIKTQPMITPKCADYVTLSFKNRWRALMSVDDVIAVCLPGLSCCLLHSGSHFQIIRWVVYGKLMGQLYCEQETVALVESEGLMDNTYFM